MSKVGRLHVTDLGPLSEAVLDDRAPVTLLLGPNESGKSTLLEALGVLYFGKRGDIDAKDGGVMTRAGARGWKIEAEVNGVEMKATKSSRPLRELCEKHLGDPRVFRSLQDVGHFLEMAPKDRKALLADLSSTDTSALADLLESEGAHQELCNAVRDGAMKKAHGIATEHRRAVGRMLKDLRARADAPVEAPLVETKGGPATVDKIPLEKVEEGLRKLLKGRQTAVDQAAERRRFESVIREAEEAQAELEEFVGDDVWSSDDEKNLLDSQREIEEWRSKAMGAGSTVSGNLKRREALLKLMKQGGDCPTCGRAVDAGAKKALKDALFLLDKEASQAKMDQGFAADKAREVEAVRADLLRRREAHRNASAVRRRLEARVQKARGVKLPPEPKVSPDQYDVDIERLTKIRDARRDYETRLQMKDQAAEKIEATQASLDAAARFEALVDPTRMEDETGVLEAFERHVSRCTKAMGVEARMDRDFAVSIQERPVALASDSLRIRAGFAFSVALSSMTGIGLAFLDRFESLDDANRKKALGMVKAEVDEGHLDWVLIAAVKVNPKRVGKVPWLASVQVDNGTTKYLQE